MVYIPNYSIEYLQTIARCFTNEDNISDIIALNSGNINKTFIVKLDPESDKKDFIIQQINSNVFKKPKLLIDNLGFVSNYLSSKLQSSSSELCGRNWQVPMLITPITSEKKYVEINKEYWRGISYISSANTYNVTNSLEQAKEVGLALAIFHFLVRDIPVESISEVIDNFHITPSYLDKFDSTNSNRRDLKDKYGSESFERVEKAIEFISLNRIGSDFIQKAHLAGDLKHRVIHGDPKISNILFDSINGQAVSLIDLDTVQPGLILYDIGDCLRSCCNSLGEDTIDIDNVEFDISTCKAILAGYSSIPANLTQYDFYYMPYIIRLLPFELGVRFLTDFLNDNICFTTSYSLQNLHRAEVQFRLVEDISLKWDSIVELVNNLRRQS